MYVTTGINCNYRPISMNVEIGQQKCCIQFKLRTTGNELFQDVNSEFAPDQ